MFSAPEDEEGPSSTSDPEETDGDDAELQAATQHLTQDFLCQVIQAEEGQGKKAENGDCCQEVGPEKEGAGSLLQVPPLPAILGKLPSAASLGLQETFQTFDKSETDGKPEGSVCTVTSSRGHCYITVRYHLLSVFQTTRHRVESWIWKVLTIRRLTR